MTQEQLQQIVDELKRLYDRGTKGPWALLGSQIRAPKDGMKYTGLVDDSQLVANFPLKPSAGGGSHVTDAYLTSDMHRALPFLLSAAQQLLAIGKLCDEAGNGYKIPTEAVRKILEAR